MRVAIAIVVGLLGGVALADKSANDQPTLAETWVGTWTGDAKWTGCSLEGDETITLAIHSLGGNLTSDGDAVWPGLGAIVWGAGGGKLAMVRDGLDLSLTPGKKSTVKLAMKTEAGCAVSATLSRGTSGMPSCDSVRALATVKSTCDSLDEATRDDDLEDVDDAWKGWKKLKGKKKKAQAKACTKQLPQLRADVASCAPGGGTVIVTPTSNATCDDLMRGLDAFLACPSIDQNMRDQLKTAIDQIKQMGGMLTDDLCQQIYPQMQQGAAALGCSI